MYDSGYNVVEAENGDVAKAMLQENLTIQLVVSDIQMPGAINGIDLVKWIKAALPHVKVLLTTGNPLAAERRPEDVPLLTKPYTSPMLFEEVELAIGAAA